MGELGDKMFPGSNPWLWNSLPLTLSRVQHIWPSSYVAKIVLFQGSCVLFSSSFSFHTSTWNGWTFASSFFFFFGGKFKGALHNDTSNRNNQSDFFSSNLLFVHIWKWDKYGYLHTAPLNSFQSICSKTAFIITGVIIIFILVYDSPFVHNTA